DLIALGEQGSTPEHGVSGGADTTESRTRGACPAAFWAVDHLDAWIFPGADELERNFACSGVLDPIVDVRDRGRMDPFALDPSGKRHSARHRLSPHDANNIKSFRVYRRNGARGDEAAYLSQSAFLLRADLSANRLLRGV